MKVLIVDDSPSNLKLLRAILESENIQVAEAPDGAEALAVLNRENVDAVISDILMPRMDGYQFCYEVRRNERWQGLPFIFYTATYTSPSDEKLCYDLGGDKYLQKPASAQTVLTALKEAAKIVRRPAPNRVASLSESDVMKEYSQRLVSKLESKNLELAQAKDRLEETNRRLEQTGVTLQTANDELETRVRRRTAELQNANEQLQAFSSSVSHDLRAPLRHIAGYSSIVLNDAASQLDETNLKHLRVIHHSANRMSTLIEALLELAQVSSGRIDRQSVNLSAIAEEVLAELRQSEPERRVQLEIMPGMCGFGDPRLLRVALMNLLANAWKFTSKSANARIEFGRIQDGANSHYCVRDNGAGFEMAYVKKLFTAFQRLHRQDDFEGTGIGLHTVRRILQRHGGRIWAESVPSKGASFYFTLGAGHGDDNPTHF